MTKKIVLGTGLFGLVTLTAGLVVGRISELGPEEAKTRFDLVERGQLEGLQSRHQASTAELARLRAEMAGLTRRNEDLDGKVAALEGELKAHREEAAKQKDAVAAARRAPISFGKWGELEAIRTAEWVELGEALLDLRETLAEMARQQKDGATEINEDLRRKQREIARSIGGPMMRLFGNLEAKLPTHAFDTGMLSHPIILSNLMAGALQSIEMSLSAEQAARIAALGEEYDAQYDAQQSTYGVDAPLLEKVLDEFDLKLRYARSMEDMLSPEQRQAVVRPEIRDQVSQDYLSPTSMLRSDQKFTTFRQRDRARVTVEEETARTYNLDPTQAARLGPAFDAWVEDVDRLLEPGSASYDITIEESMIAAEAQVKLLRAVLRLPDLTEEARSQVLGETRWLIPRVWK